MEKKGVSAINPPYGRKRSLPSTKLLAVGEHTLFSAWSLNLVDSAIADESVTGLEFLQGLSGVINKGEAGGLSTTIVGAEAKY